MTALVPQIVNLNGTSGDELVRQYTAVLTALNKLQAVMAEATPHGRDYQTSRTAFAGETARKAWSERRMMLRELHDEIEAARLDVFLQTRDRA